MVRFADFEVDSRSGELRKSGGRVRLPEQSFQILALLLDRAGEVVTREELHQRLWPAGTFVDFDAGLNNAIRKLREALADPADSPRYIETLPRRGYRFIASVEAPPVEPLEPTAARVPARRAGFRRWLPGAGVAVAVLAAVLVALALSGTRDLWRGRSVPVKIESLAVLPFENLTGEDGQDYFVDGMTDALITNLAQVRALRVISRTSVMQYKRANKSLPRIAEELDVDAVVEGTVARSGDRVRVTAQLIHAPSDRHLWARSYERERRDVLALQGELAAAIAQAIQVKLQPQEQRRLTRTTAVQPDAYEAYLKGRFYRSERSPGGLLKAVGYFQQAIEQDPAYAPAHSGLSDAYRLLFRAIFSCLPARNAGAIDALIWITPPVLGLRPVRAARLRASKFPKPVICTFAPFFNSPAMMPLSSNRASIVRPASAFDILVRIASAVVSSALFTEVSLVRTGSKRP